MINYLPRPSAAKFLEIISHSQSAWDIDNLYIKRVTPITMKSILRSGPSGPMYFPVQGHLSLISATMCKKTHVFLLIFAKENRMNED